MEDFAKLEKGDQIPQFDALTQSGQAFSNQSIVGKKTIFFFFPAAGSPGCTMESVEFNNELEAFESGGFQVVGVSPDSVVKLAEFQHRHGLNYTFLSDESFAVHKAFGAYGNKSLYGQLYRGVLRSTIAIDENGQVILPLYNVKATGHVAMLLRKLGL